MLDHGVARRTSQVILLMDVRRVIAILVLRRWDFWGLSRVLGVEMEMGMDGFWIPRLLSRGFFYLPLCLGVSRHTIFAELKRVG